MSGGGNRDVRSLVTLMQSASTARVLNLLAARTRSAGDPDYQARPLFKNKSLNGSIILKHRLRKHEAESLRSRRGVATKILFPIDPCDLAAGARYLFVGQQGFDAMLEQSTGLTRNSEEATHDLEVIAALEELPSLDPFLTREHLKRRGFSPSNAYFAISSSDTDRMFKHVQGEMWPLVRMCYGEADVGGAQAQRLVSKILADELDADFEPLRLTLRLSETQYLEGMFCWKGFLYYKWALAGVLDQASQISAAIATVKPVGPVKSETAAYLREARERLRDGVRSSCEQVKAMLQVYDDAFEGLTQRSDPTAFRDFLLAAPDMFFKIGERLGAVQHIVSFWSYRVPAGRKPSLTADDLAELLQDFEQSLGLAAKTQLAWA